MKSVSGSWSSSMVLEELTQAQIDEITEMIMNKVTEFGGSMAGGFYDLALDDLGPEDWDDDDDDDDDDDGGDSSDDDDVYFPYDDDKNFIACNYEIVGA